MSEEMTVSKTPAPKTAAAPKGAKKTDAGADVATMPPGVIRGLFRHVLTDKGIEQFLADWKKTGQSL